MKILSFTKNGNPNCLGGIETFQRNLYKIFGEEIKFLTFKSQNRGKYFNIKNIVEFDLKKNFFVKFLIKLVGKSNYIYYIAKRMLKKNTILVLNSPNDIRKLYKLNCKKILVQHNTLENYKKSFIKKSLNVPIMIRKYVDCYVFLSKYDQEKFIK